MPPSYLFIMHNYERGGAEKVCCTLLEHLASPACTLTVGCVRPMPAVRAVLPPDLPCLMPATTQFWDRCKNIHALWRAARASDCVVGTLELQSIFWAALLAPHRCIGWLHKDLQGYYTHKSPFFQRIYTYIFAWCARRSACIVCASRGVQLSAQQLFPELREKFIHIPNPIDLQDIRTKAQAALPAVLHATFQHAVVLSAGRLVRQKAYQNLITAHALLRQRGYTHHLCILGEGPERASLEALCRTLGVADSVLLPGFLSPYAPMRHAKVFALSSDFEGLSLVILEALALGLPVVSTDCPSGPREVLQDGACGSLVPTGNPQKLADALAPFVTDNALPPSPEHSARGQARAAAFDIGHCVHTWETLLRSVNKNSGRPLTERLAQRVP